MTSGSDLCSRLISLGFDVKAGIEFCGNDEEFYIDLIREFHADVLPRRASSLRSNDADVQRAFAHMLKGTLRTLGAGEASKKAHDLELALRRQESGPELSDDLLMALDEMHVALSGLLHTV